MQTRAKGSHTHVKDPVVYEELIRQPICWTLTQILAVLTASGKNPAQEGIARGKQPLMNLFTSAFQLCMFTSAVGCSSSQLLLCSTETPK